ncbi:MAG: hypothetical protein VR68_13705 [Peptococcaceae bacterium BRH_c4a]|nr:MAG: hypothetical protein VR68_13705 [Peptococcaceae bacterium BRH_c4a]
MKNKIILFILLMALVAAPFAYAGPTEEARLLQFFESYLPGLPADQQEAATETARVVTNDELRSYNNYRDYYQETILDGKRLNPLNFAEYVILAYGDRYGTFRDGENRYLGYTAMKEAYTNVFFRPDFADGVQIDQADWLPIPWENGLVEEFLERLREPVLKKNDFNNQPLFRDNILSGFEVLNQLYPDYYGLNHSAAKDRDWEKYVQILQPPSRFCWGTGRMFRQLPDKSIRYMDVPLISFGDAALDFSVSLEKDSYQAKPGEVIKTTATFELNKEYFKSREAKLRLYLETATDEIELSFTPVDPAKKLNGSKYTFKPGEKLEVRFSFSAPNGPAEIVASIDGTFIKGVTWVEKNSDDNEDRAPVIVAIPDLSTNLETDSFNVKPGEKITSTVAYKLDKDHSKPERALLRMHHVVDGQEYPIQLQPVNGAPVPDKDGYVTLQPGDVKVYEYTFSVQSSNTIIRSRINPVDTNQDTNWSNNRAEASVIISQHDIKVEVRPEKDSYTAINGGNTGLNFIIRVSRKDDIPGKIRAIGYFEGFNGKYAGRHSMNTTLGPGEYKEIMYGFPAPPGSYTTVAEAWPEGFEDAFPPDNKDESTVYVGNQIFKPDSKIRVDLIDGGPIYR